MNYSDILKKSGVIAPVNKPSVTIPANATFTPTVITPTSAPNMPELVAPTYTEALGNSGQNAGIVSPVISVPDNAVPGIISSPPTPTFTDIANAKLPSVNEIPNNIKVNSPGANIEAAVKPTFAPGNINADSLGKAHLNGQEVKYTTGTENVGGTPSGDGTVTINIGGSGAAGGEKTETVQPKMPFEQWYESTKKGAHDTYDKTVADAETARQKSVVNARNSYDHAVSSYGSNAAALGNMGLTGSGYSAYLDSKAYAQMRADQNAAAAVKQSAVDNAEAIKAGKIADADARYMDYLNQQEALKKQETANKEALANESYTNMLSNIGRYTSGNISNLGKYYGLSNEQINELQAARVENAKQLLDSSDGYSKTDLDRLFDTSNPEEKTLYDTYYDKLKNETQGYISGMTAESFAGMTSEEARTLIGQYEQSGLGIDVSQAQAAYNAAYKLHTNGSVTLHKEKGGGDDGDKIKVKVNDEKYTLRYEGDETLVTSLTKDKTANEIADVIKSANLPENTIFVYDGVMYIVTGRYQVGTVAFRKITSSKNKSDSYKTVYNALKENSNEE